MGRFSALNMLLSNSILRQVRVRPNPLFLEPRFAYRFMSEQAKGTFLDKSEVTDRVVTVVKAFQKVDPSKVSPHAHFHKDLGLDSLDSVELVMALEEEFSFEIPDKDADKIESITNAIDYIASHPEAK